MTVKQSLKAFLVEILCFAMVFPSLSYASPHAAQPDWGAAAYVHHDALEQVAKKLNRDGFLIENVQASVLGQFRTQADINYFWLQSKRYVRPVAAHVEAQGDTLVVTGQGMPTVTFSEINSAEHTMKINGHLFDSSVTRSLEATHQEIAKLMGGETPARSTQVIDWVFPSAYAFAWFAVALVAFFIVMPAWALLKAENSLDDDLDAVIKACQNRDPKIPYEKSEAHQKLRELEKFIKHQVDLTYDPNCKKAVTRAATGTAVRTATLIGFCEKKNQLTACMGAYKRGAAPSPQKAEEAIPVGNAAAAGF